jgi:uroporphyrinogen decarboxylase
MPVVKAIGSDAIPLLIEPKKWKRWVLQDQNPVQIPAKINIQKNDANELLVVADDGTCVARCPAGGIYFDPVHFPLANAQTVADIDAGKKYFESFDWPGFIDEDFDDLRTKAQKLYNETDYAIVGNLWVHLLAAGMYLRGYENFMVDLVINKKLAHRILENQLAAYLPRVEKYIEAVGDYVQVIQVNDDLGSQNGPLLSPELYREMIKPYHKKLWQFIKEKSGKPILLHSCGSIYKLIPDLIEIGIDALNPIQVSAANMDSATLKKEFGKDLTFWGGGCDTQNVLGTGTPQQVRDEVKRRVDDFAPGGGFVFCQVHNIQPNVPPENIMAMYDQLQKLSK